ncbi:type VII secretion system-associated protein [Amycolatopsis rhizosphaerae]|uniref:Type VII secretion system-associated protein n=1 Tax=Amycolatopsis rhizosphaerae TaxID=2053003 RepID=A0A558DKR8_9PSEU|nr:type VII secretion system-associated protein [Amycolatopsis rhizosphaerae]TVT61605.1 type VII secretion system-associated protein [Amycolatopsis rhizosphaerae]
MSEPDDERRDVPPITPQMREAARGRPGGYLYAIDAAYDPYGDVPPHAIKGAFAVGEDGEIGQYQANPGYRPSAVEREPPANWIDHGMRLAMAGQLGREQFLRVIGGAVLSVLVSPERAPMLLDAEGGPCLWAYAAPAVAPRKLSTERVYLPRLLRLLPPEVSLLVNGTAGLQARVPVTDLLAALRTAHLLIDNPDGGFDVGPRVWVEQGARLAGLVDEETFTAIEQALAQWGRLSQTEPERSAAIRLGITAVEVLVRGGVRDTEVLAAAAVFRAVEPLHGGERDTLREAADGGARVPMLLRSATSPHLPNALELGREKLVYRVYVEHLRKMPWVVRAIVLANRIADIATPEVPATRRENRRYDLAGPLLSCARDFPERLRAQVAEYAGADPAGATPLPLGSQPPEVIISAAKAVDRVRATTGKLLEPVRVDDIGMAYRVRSDREPEHVHFVHKLCETVSSEIDYGAATEKYRARYGVFTLRPGQAA